jgi:hypothetical protein
MTPLDFSASPAALPHRRLDVRSAVVTILVLALATGCSDPESSFSAVQPTLAALDTLGFRCGDGAKDNVPSGLLQWSCSGEMEGAALTVLVDGNEEGTAGITLLVDDPGDPGLAGRAFGRLVDAVPPLSNAPVLKDSVAAWTGRQQALIVGGVRVSAECDTTHCVITVAPSRDPLRPLPLP